MEIENTINNLINEIQNTVNNFGNNSVVIAFSGGLDSTVVSLLAKDALGPENIELVNIVYGLFTYNRSIEIVKNTAEKMGLKVIFVKNLMQKEIWKYGPSCNMCTKTIKMESVKEYAKDRLVITGSNSSDSWGKTGLKLFNGMYAPLGDLDKKTIRKILEYYSFKLERIGEHSEREGCKLKHLLKIMTNLDFHGKAVSLSNEILLEHLPKNMEIANVKIIGPLSKNIAIINVKPMVENIEEIAQKISEVDVIDEVIIANKPLILHVIANPSIYRVEQSKFWIHQGKLQPEFAVPIKIKWEESRNNKLRTIHVVGVEEWKDYQKELKTLKKPSDINSIQKNSCSLL